MVYVIQKRLLYVCQKVNMLKMYMYRGIEFLSALTSDQDGKE